MIGLLVVTHRGLAAELIATAELIVGKIENCVGLSIDPELSVEDLRRQLTKAIGEVNLGDGVIVLTDMFGGTPSNLSLSFLNQKGIEVVTGVNLPMLIKLARGREKVKVDELAQFIKNYGRRSISLASEILSKNAE
jgi:PTS system mannose-specific IIA component